ncbi:hypothetical protein BGX21_007727 [Mortierella sp. AD011]|nr:hypothetical protein BGX20_008233 [Mortierella sp. AD010]KAF9402982.1 hypothetical protein BGX21_007727 [Mortierella sp. AD011]
MAASLKLFELVDGKTRTISFSPAVWRARFALNYKKIPHEVVSLTFLEVPTVIHEACPNIDAPTVPTLQLETGQGLLDSLAIAEYLEEKYPDRPLLFGSPAEKKLQLFFQSYIQARIHPAIQRLVFEGMYNMQDDENALYFRASREKSAGQPYQEIPGDRNENIKEIRENLGLIHNVLKSGDWIMGDHPGWADFVLASSFMWFSSCSPNDFKEGILEAFDDQVFPNFWNKIQHANDNALPSFGQSQENKQKKNGILKSLFGAMLNKKDATPTLVETPNYTGFGNPIGGSRPSTPASSAPYSSFNPDKGQLRPDFPISRPSSSNSNYGHGYQSHQSTDFGGQQQSYASSSAVYSHSTSSVGSRF